MYYNLPPEFFNLFPDKQDFLWKGNIQLYGDVEASKHWHKRFFSWLCTNILDYRQALCDPSLLYSPITAAVTPLCTDNALNIIPASLQQQEAKMSKRFQCRDAVLPPTDFKGLDILCDGDDICISQAEYSKKIYVSSSLKNATKHELSRDMTQDETSQLRSDAGQLAWLAVGAVSVGGYSDTVSGRTTCAPCKAEWPSVASMLTSACTLVVGYSAVVGACQRVDRELHACGQLHYGLANQGLIFSLVLLYYFTLGSYVYNYARWQRRTPPA